jgi:hypothetical protein
METCPNKEARHARRTSLILYLGLPEQAGSEADGDPTGEEHARSKASGDLREEQVMDRPEELVIGGDEAHVEVVIGRWLLRVR